MFESFMLDHSTFERDRVRNAQFKYLYCCSEDERTPRDEEEKKFSSFGYFWQLTKQCRNIETISIPGNLVIDIDTLRDRLPELKDVIIRVGGEEFHKTAESFRAHFSKRLFVGKNGVTMDTLPNHEVKRANRVVPYIPELFPGVKRAAVCRNPYEDELDYNWPIKENEYPEYGIIDLGLEVLQQAQDCL